MLHQHRALAQLLWVATFPFVPIRAGHIRVDMGESFLELREAGACKQGGDRGTASRPEVEMAERRLRGLRECSTFKIAFERGQNSAKEVKMVDY
jgi:hypothetical protein